MCKNIIILNVYSVCVMTQNDDWFCVFDYVKITAHIRFEKNWTAIDYWLTFKWTVATEVTVLVLWRHMFKTSDQSYTIRPGTLIESVVLNMDFDARLWDFRENALIFLNQVPFSQFFSILNFPFSF